MAKPSARVPARPTGPKGIAEVRLKAALRKHAGVYALAARDLGCDRSNVRHRVDRSPALQEFVAQIEQEVGDAAEAVVKRDILGGSVKTAKWYLTMKHKDRGYTTRTEVSGPDGGAIPVAQEVVVRIEYVSPKVEPQDEDVPI